MTDGRELPGAKLKITDASGNIIAEWETNGQPHRIERLKPGEYTLIETAPRPGIFSARKYTSPCRRPERFRKLRCTMPRRIR